MMDFYDGFDYEVTKVEPVYDYSKVAGGYFLVYFGAEDDDPFKLSFVPFLDHYINTNEKLFNYLKKTSKDKTVSHAIYDLYDIGFPIEKWVADYIDMAKGNVGEDMSNTLIMFYNYIKNFNPSGSYDK